MTVKELSLKGGFNVLAMPDGDRDITGVYIGDLLSWVMGKANSGDVWITIMSNLNIIAVASLADTACIILAEGVTLEGEVIETAVQKGINILQANEGIYEIALRLGGML